MIAVRKLEAPVNPKNVTTLFIIEAGGLMYAPASPIPWIQLMNSEKTPLLR
jgi:hypothetical protein